jgi:hypothetical protein
MHVTKAFHALDAVHNIVKDTMEVADSQEIEVCVFKQF